MIRFGWETFKKRPWLFIGVMFLIVAANIVLGQIVKVIGAERGASLAGEIINIAGGALVGMGTLAFFLKAHDTPESASVNDLWHPKSLWKYVGAIFLSGIVIAVVATPFFIVAIFFGIGALLSQNVIGPLAGVAIVFGLAGIMGALLASSFFVFAPYAVVDRGSGPIVAIKSSFGITKGKRLKIVGFLCVIALLNILGFVALFVGILVTAPVSLLALTHLYRSLTGSGLSA